jgi:hypothetical protein
MVISSVATGEHAVVSQSPRRGATRKEIGELSMGGAVPHTEFVPTPCPAPVEELGDMMRWMRCVIGKRQESGGTLFELAVIYLAGAVYSGRTVWAGLAGLGCTYVRVPGCNAVPRRDTYACDAMLVRSMVRFELSHMMSVRSVIWIHRCRGCAGANPLKRTGMSVPD